MTGAGRAAVFVVVLATGAWAQDPPPAPEPAAHENKVSPAAKAAAERFDRLAYRPAEHGLTSISAVLGSGTAPSRPLWRFEFTPPGRPKLSPAPGANPAPAQSQAAEIQLALPLRAAYEGVPLFDGKEYDADVVEREGRRVLVLTTYHDGVKGRTSEFTLNEEGLLVGATAIAPAEAVNPVMKLAWEKVGDLRRIAAIDLTMIRGEETLSRFTFTLAYSDVAGVNIMTSFELMGSVTEGGKARDIAVSVRLDSLSLNGKPDDRPRPAAHANKISTEAKAAMDAYAKLVYRPAEHGLVSLTGTIVPDWTKTPKTSTFEFRAPNIVSVAMTGDAKPDSPGAKAAVALHKFGILAALDGVRIGGTPEYDAAFADKDGARWLEVVEYGGGARTGTNDVALDARGLVTSLRRRGGPDPAAPTSDVTIRVTWAKFGSLWRVESADLVSGPSDTTTFSHYAFQFGTIDGFGVPTSYVRTHVEAGKDAKAFPYRIEDLVINGKKAEALKPDSGTDDGK